jgi:hypothetical protein
MRTGPWPLLPYGEGEPVESFHKAHREILRHKLQQAQADLERRADAWSVRTVDLLEEQQKRLQKEFEAREHEARLALLGAQEQIARLRGARIQTLDADELRALEGELAGALQRVARMRGRRAAEARVLQAMPSAKCQISLACMQVGVHEVGVHEVGVHAGGRPCRRAWACVCLSGPDCCGEPVPRSGTRGGGGWALVRARGHHDLVPGEQHRPDVAGNGREAGPLGAAAELDAAQDDRRGG